MRQDREQCNLCTAHLTTLCYTDSHPLMASDLGPLTARDTHLSRFIKYSAVGISTFILDLGLLIIVTDILHIDPVLAAGITFLVAITINYLLSRRYVFHETTKSQFSTYVVFISLGIGGLGLVMGLMHFATNILGWHYVESRILIAGIVGILNYLLNLYVNFSVAHAPHTDTTQKN